ncbi:uncharacterized protein LOC126455707 [Schistocerca serialis cubense]|uniref:uncharacterized protein LOC126455707 n=1 Tax=Schistocerca serialis cubense TaxID=2023355 RepID=UPI00214EDC95|nr:uncharacterized protein LOC126455707 [Schistocerca serialis cubense]
MRVTMENYSLDNVGIELIQGSQNRGDENEYCVSSVFEDISELETILETQGEQSCLASGISANINSRQPQDVTLGRSLPRQTGIRSRTETKGASALTSNRDSLAVQSDDSSVYLSASLDDVDAVPNSVTCCLEHNESAKEGEGALQKTDDTKEAQSSTSKCSVTINFRLTEEQFCCSSRELPAANAEDSA